MSDLPFLIAEIGINHNGDVSIAKKLIDDAKNAGFDAVKFQKRDIDIVYSKEFLESHRESPWGTTQRQQKEGIEFGYKEFEEIDAHCKSLNITWFASPWDLNSVDFLEKFKVPYYKIASPLIGHKPLVEKIARLNKKTFISTGMSNINEIEEVVSIFKKYKTEFELMHCVSTYPMDFNDANLLSIKFLQNKFNVNVGWSGHEKSLITISLIAVSLGATSVERHITLDRTMYGSDQAASIESKNLKEFALALKSVNSIMGIEEKKVNAKEIPIRNKLKINIE